MTNRSHPWPTDGVTKKQLDRLSDKMTRRVDHWADKVRGLEAAIETLQVQQQLLLATNSKLAEFLQKQG